ncbi:MAG: acyltransferase [Pleurocapsa sp. MO_226.B13]|nr:acyltransferase [Pleurocapsa sp. MO_226.B13]
MKTEAFLVQANHHIQQVITCAITDQLLRNLAVPVVFFYRESFDRNALIDSLREVLSDFPFFAGILKKSNNNLYIDCNNQGVLFSVARENCTVNQILEKLPRIKKERLVNIINPKKVIPNQSPLMTINLTYFACGGMALGICWHHSIGDMHTFMQLMKAWSNSANKKEYILPLITKERDKYLQENLEENNNNTPAVRYLNGRELFELAFYMLFQARNKTSLRFYFSENELNNMKQKFSENAHRNLSRNDVLCAHLFNIISELDEYSKERVLSIAINYRSKMKLPENISGNFGSSINISVNQRVKPFQLAKDLRASVDNFEQLHMNFFSTKKYIEEKGGINKIDRFVSKGIDPLKRTLLVTSWVNFGTYDIIFGESKPFYFSSFGDYPFPWLSSITEGFSNNGLFYSVLLPSKLAKNLMQHDNLRRIHRYRDQKEVMPELVGKLKWLL